MSTRSKNVEYMRNHAIEGDNRRLYGVIAHDDVLCASVVLDA